KLLACSNLSTEQKKMLGQQAERIIQVKLKGPGLEEIPIFKEKFPHGFDYAYVDKMAAQYFPNRRKAGKQ
ncbi:hypothetical protein MKX01_035712, partial [Papaver californicum]